MPLIKDTAAVDATAVQTAVAETQASTALEAVVGDSTQSDLANAAAAVDASAAVLEPEPQAEPVQASASTAVADTSQQTTSVSSQRSASNAAVMKEMASEGHEGLHLDFSSFPGIVLKDGEFQITGGTRSFSATAGFDGIVTGSREKFAYRVGGDDDGDVVFANDMADFSNPDKESCQKLAEWRAEGLKPELKTYLECYVMLTEVHDEAAKDLVGELVVVQVSPTSVGRYSGYAATQRFKHKVNPDGLVTRFARGEKITSGKFPYYPWAFKFVSLA